MPTSQFCQTRAAWIAVAVACGIACSTARRAEAQVTSPVARPVSGDSAAALQARADSARYAYTAADIRFMTAMMGHHAQAITMSRMAPTHGASPAVRTLASRIINSQQDEIATMGHWLRDRHQPVPDVLAGEAHAGHRDAGQGDATRGASMAAGMSMPGMSMSPSMSNASTAGMQMPGMLSAAQMAQLDRARGAEFDRLFLTYMIQHHRGAVGMVDGLFGTNGAGQDETVFKFASDVHVDQTTEIARMQQMLAALLSDP